jgi:ATP-dependent DNA ligase
MWHCLVTLKGKPPALASSLSRMECANVIWIAPRIVVEVEVRGWTTGGRIRAASLKRFREDKRVQDVG